MKNSYQQQGITMVQILLFVGLLGIVILSFTLLLGQEREKTRNYARIASVKQLQASIEMFYSQNGSYPAVAKEAIKEGSGHNWLPEMTDAGIGNTFQSFLPQPLTASLPADSSACRAIKKCGEDTSAIANDFCYTSYPAGCSSSGQTKCTSYTLDFCLSEQTQDLTPGVHSVSSEGIK